MTPKPPTLAELLGATLLSIREERGLTQAELAERSGVARNTISGYERGISVLSADSAYYLAHALAVTPHELFYGADAWDGKHTRLTTAEAKVVWARALERDAVAKLEKARARRKALVEGS